MKRWGIVNDTASTLRGRLKVVPETEGAYVLYFDYREELAKKEEEIKGLNVKINHLAEDIKQMEETIRRV